MPNSNPQLDQLRQMSIKLDQMTNTANKLAEEARPNKALAIKQIEESGSEAVDQILASIEETLKDKPKTDKAAVVIALQNFCGANEHIVTHCLNNLLAVNRDTTKLDKIRKQRRHLLNAYNALKEYLEGEGVNTSGIQRPTAMTKGGPRATTIQRKARF